MTDYVLGFWVRVRVEAPDLETALQVRLHGIAEIEDGVMVDDPNKIEVAPVGIHLSPADEQRLKAFKESIARDMQMVEETKAQLGLTGKPSDRGR